MSKKMSIVWSALALLGVMCALVASNAAHAQEAAKRPAPSTAAGDSTGPGDDALPQWSLDDEDPFGDEPLQDDTLDEAADAAEDDAATEKTARDERIEELKVRGTKRQGNLQETPISASVFDMQQLDTANIQTFEDLAPSIPNFSYNEVVGAASFTIRGIQSLGGSSATAMHIDGIYQQNPYTASGIQFYDLDGVEVIRGPTGTEYGRGATAGALNILTKQPGFDFESFGDIQVGSYHEIRIRGVLNVPVVDDKVAVRASGIVNRRYGYTENLESDVRSGDLDDDRTMSIRGQVRVQPTDNINWVTRATYVRDRSNGLSLKIDGEYPDPVPLVAGLPPLYIYYNAPQPNPPDPRQVYFDSPTNNDRDFIMANSTFTLALDDLPGMTNSLFTLAGGYQYSDQAGGGDLDFSNAPSFGDPSGAYAGPYEMIRNEITGESSEWVAEASFEATTPLPPDEMDLGWLVGAFYFGSKTDISSQTYTAFQGRTSTDPTAPAPLFFIVDATQLTAFDPTRGESHGSRQSAALFANADWTLFDDVTLFGGLRYSWDWGDASVLTSGADAAFPDTPAIPRICIGEALDDDEDGSWGGLIGRAGIEWRATEENMVYASYHSGYKPGTLELERGATGCTVVPSENTQPERINAWELGSKNRFFDDKIQANLTGFIYLWDDIQVSTLVNTTLITQNAESALAAGFEIETVFLPFSDFDPTGFSIDTFLMTFNFGYTYSEFTDFDNGCLVEDPTTCIETDPNYDPQDWTGNQLPRSPRYTFTITAQYEQTLGRYGSLTPFIRYFYSDYVFFRAANDRATDLQPAYGLLDLTLSWRSADKTVSLEGFVNNVLNDDIVSQKLISSYLIGAPVLSSYMAPRTWGVRLGLQW